MKILVLGSGGREHALAARLSIDPGVEGVFVCPGNPGMKLNTELGILGGQLSLEHVLSIVREKAIDLVVIGPEKYLFDGYSDALRDTGVATFGPSRDASFLEESKNQSKQFMKEFGIPTSGFEIARSLVDANGIIAKYPQWQGYVLKLSGPALGKGVVVTDTEMEAREAAHQFFLYHPPGIEDGVVIEEKVSGREVSLFYICDGEDFRFLASACDHKRLLDDDNGPNTGGMGAYSPCTWIDGEFLKQVESKVVRPTLAGMNTRGTPFSGMLFLGLMVNDSGFSLLEYNTRFGDPETQTFLPILDGNLAEALYASATGTLADFHGSLSSEGHFALHVVKAARGYPGVFGESVETGQTIHLQREPLSSAQLYFAGVQDENGSLISSGGRVLGVTGIGGSPKEAKANAYENLAVATFSGEQYRSDIGGTQ